MAHSDLGFACGKLGWVDAEVRHVRAALAVCSETDDSALEAVLLNHLAITYRQQGCFDEAIEQFAQALVGHRRCGNRHDEALVLNNLGSAYEELGRLDEAVSHGQRSLAIHRELGNRRGEAIALGNLASTHLRAKRGAEHRLLPACSPGPP